MGHLTAPGGSPVEYPWAKGSIFRSKVSNSDCEDKKSRLNCKGTSQWVDVQLCIHCRISQQTKIRKKIPKAESEGTAFNHVVHGLTINGWLSTRATFSVSLSFGSFVSFLDFFDFFSGVLPLINSPLFWFGNSFLDTTEDFDFYGWNKHLFPTVHCWTNVTAWALHLACIAVETIRVKTSNQMAKFSQG